MPAVPKSIKKLAKVGEGIAVFLTQEARILEWKQGEYVSVEVAKGGPEEKIVLRRIKM